MVLYKTGKFLQASVAQVAFKFGNKKKLTVQILLERLLNQVKGTIQLETNEEENFDRNARICTHTHLHKGSWHFSAFHLEKHFF